MSKARLLAVCAVRKTHILFVWSAIARMSSLCLIVAVVSSKSMVRSSSIRAATESTLQCRSEIYRRPDQRRLLIRMLPMPVARIDKLSARYIGFVSGGVHKLTKWDVEQAMWSVAPESTNQIDRDPVSGI